MAQKGFTRKFKPLKILSEEDIKAIHRGVLYILENTGIRFESKKALELFEAHNCIVNFDKMLVKFPPGLVEKSLKMVPSSFSIKSRDPKNDLIIGGDNLYFEASVGQDFVDLETLERRPATIKDNNDGVKVLDYLENVHLLLSYCPYMNIKDIPPALLITKSMESRFRYSTKISRTAHSNDSDIFDIKMAYATNQYVTIAMEPSPPLTWSEDAINAGFRGCETPFPILFSNGDIMGGTAPASIAGSLVTSIAEEVSGIVMINLLKPGKEIVVTNFVFPMEMVNGQPDFNSITCSLHTAAFNQYFRNFNIPIRNGAGQFSLAKNIGYQIGSEKALSLIISALTGANIIAVTGGLFAELSWSPVIAVLDNDLAGAVGYFIEGANIGDETLALDIIDRVGPIPGSFLGEESTRKWWETEFFIPKIMDRLPYEVWKIQGKKSEIDNAKNKVKEIIKTHKVSVPLNDEQSRELDNIYAEAKKFYEERGLI
jgi:trimethylamine---corrinoid protein Co-methyltransferase